MTPPLPLPVRVAAGLVATAVEQARGLPRLALELPVTAVSQALQASMRLQQKVTELAIKGDQVLGVGPPIVDEPAWATFDDDVPPARSSTKRNGRAGSDSGGAAEARATTPPRPAPPRPTPPRPAPGSTPPASTPPGTAPRGTTPPRPRRATVTPLRPAPDPFDDPGPVDPGSEDPEGLDKDVTGSAHAGANGVGADDTASDTAVDGPAAGIASPAGPPDAAPKDQGPARPAVEDAPDILPGYANLTIPQLRGKLRYLGLDELRALLAWEQAHGDRPPFVTMLSNRIATVSDGG